MSSLTDIMDSIETKLVAITPTVRPQAKFHVARGSEPLARSFKDTDFDRSFRLVPTFSPVVNLDYGGVAREESQIVQLQVGYHSRQKDGVLSDRVTVDSSQIMTALQSSGLSWPSTLVNIYPEPGAALTDVAGDGSNALLLTMPWRIVYDEATP